MYTELYLVCMAAMLVMLIAAQSKNRGMVFILFHNKYLQIIK